MRKLPRLEIDFNELNNLYFGTVTSRLMMTAIKMKVFDHLGSPESARNVAEALDSHYGNTELMLDALCACGLVEKKSGRYSNRKLAHAFLVCGKPAYLGEWLEQADEAMRPFLEKMEDRIRIGPGEVAKAEDMNSETYCERYTASHAASSLAGIARQFAVQIEKLPAFSSCRTMLDLGGGPGINAMAVAETNPNLQATVFDRPEIARMARCYIETYGFADRVRAVGGDYLNDPLGTGYDMIMITDSLYYDDQKIDRVLEKCGACLRPGGMLVGIHAVLTDERTRPVHLVLDLLAETMTGQAHMPEKGFLARALGRCGFDGITSTMVVICGIPMEMNVGYAKSSD